MVAQKCKKKKKPKKNRPYERILEHPETEGPSKLFLPENNFETCDTVSFLKNHPDFGDLDMKFRLFFHMPLHIYELNIIQKISRKRLKIYILQFFDLSIS